MANTLFDQLPAAQPPAPRPPPTNGRAMSNAAAESVAPVTPHLREMVYHAVRLAPNGLTREEIEKATGMMGNTVRPRVVELLEAGRLKEEGKRALKSGKMGAG